MTAGETHDPAAHEKPAAQAWPHEPQFFGSEGVLTQALAHSVWLAVHVGCAPQLPAVQTCVEASPEPQLVPFGAFGFEHAPVAVLQVPARWHASRAVQVTGLLPVHAPPWHASLLVQAFPSLHVVPSAEAGFEQLPVVGSHVPGEWHWSDAVQVTGLEPTQTPAVHSLVWLHLSVPAQTVPSAAAGFEHPVVGLHVPATWHASLAVHVTVPVPTQVPDWQASDGVHALPSLHVVPLGTAGFEHAPEVGSHVPATWHWSLAEHVTGVDPVHAPATHAYIWLHLLLPVQVVPSGAAGSEHTPVLGLHEPATWHASLEVQVTGFEPMHVPLWQVSLWVQAFPSLQAVPLAAAGLEHTPLLGSHVPAEWHWSLAVQVTGLEPTQTPTWQESDCVHAFPSLHVVPLGNVGLAHAPLVGSHVPAAWHWSAAAHVTGFEPVQVPARQASVWVHALPSSHVVPSGAAGDEQAPLAGSQLPARWHWSTGAQVTGVPAHVPAWHDSSCVQRLPSLQAVPSLIGEVLQAPVTGSQTPTAHGPELLHCTVFDPTQYPALQACVCRQASPVSHAVPSGLGTSEHWPLDGSQLGACMHCASGDEKSSAVSRAAMLASRPPATRMAPVPVVVAVCPEREVLELIGAQLDVAGSKTSPPVAWPPSTNTRPFGSTAAAASTRAVLIEPAEVQTFVAGS
jgi:hypothetical protein